MIRKAIIVVLTLGSVGALGLFIVSWSWYVMFNATWRIELCLGSVGVVSPALGEPGWHVMHLDEWGSHRVEKAPFDVPVWWPFFFHGFTGSGIVRHGGQVAFVVVPLLLPFLLFAAYPTVAFIRGPMRRWRRRRKGLCLSCGYDLTGNESGVCPECGGGNMRFLRPIVRTYATLSVLWVLVVPSSFFVTGDALFVDDLVRDATGKVGLTASILMRTCFILAQLVLVPLGLFTALCWIRSCGHRLSNVAVFGGVLAAMWLNTLVLTIPYFGTVPSLPGAFIGALLSRGANVGFLYYTPILS